MRVCVGGRRITIPDSVISIGNYVFCGCAALTSVSIPKSVTSIGDYAFNNCAALVSVSIPDRVTSIGEGTFSGCAVLTSVSIPEGVTTIGDYAFFGCKALTSVSIPASVTGIGKEAFFGCGSLIHIELAGKDVAFSESTFDTGSGTDMIIRAPAGSATMSRLKKYGLKCHAMGGGLTLKNPLSTDRDNPTRIPALETRLDLNNVQGYAVKTIVVSTSRGTSRKEITDNMWHYDGTDSYLMSASVVLMYEDSAGTLCATQPYYIRYGVAELAEPRLLDPSISRGKEVSLLPYRDFRITWQPDENAESYRVRLYYSTGFFDLWSSEELHDNTCLIPASAFPALREYYNLYITVYSRVTGEQRSAWSDTFSFYSSDAVTSSPMLSSPVRDGVVFSPDSPIYMPTIPYTGDLKLKWGPVENAVSYRVQLNAHEFNDIYHIAFQGETTEPSLTIPKETIDGYINYDIIRYFSIDVEAVDRWGGSASGIGVAFWFGDPDAVKVQSDGLVLSRRYGTETGLSAGEHTFTWDAVEGADYYAVTLTGTNRTGGSLWAPIPGSFKVTEPSFTAELNDQSHYVLTVRAVSDTHYLDGGWYFINVNAADHPDLKLTAPVTDFFPEPADLTVKWNDTGAESYTVTLSAMAVEEIGEQSQIGMALGGYSLTVDEHTSLTGTKTTFDAGQLEYRGLYQITVTAHYPDCAPAEIKKRFKVGGDPQWQPAVRGMAMDKNAASPRVNRTARDITAEWTAREGASLYEMILYTLDSAGGRLDLVETLSSQTPSITLGADVLQDQTSYQLELREVDRDGFSSEYRLCFRLEYFDRNRNLVLPDALTQISDEAFMGDTGLEYVTIGSHVVSIGKNAFRNCANLVYIAIPDSVTQIGDDAFSGCPELVICCSEKSAAYLYAVKNGIQTVNE